MKWEVLNQTKIQNPDEIVSVILENRGIKSKKEKEEFLNPKSPIKIEAKEIGLKNEVLKKTIGRIKSAKKKKEFVIVYGDYDADGITATAILWESLHDIGIDTLPFIPDRFEDGYGIRPETVEKLKNKFPNLSLIITVDNGIVAYDGIKKAKEYGIDVIVIDHHQKGTKRLSTEYLLHTTSICGSALAWFFSRELTNDLKIENCLPAQTGKLKINERLSLAAIGTVADQIPLIGVNRSLVKFGLKELEISRRPGLIALFHESGIKKDLKIPKIGTYEINYIIAPRINAMGRLKNGIESLRLLCTKNAQRALEIAGNMGITNKERQKIVEEVLFVARQKVTDEKIIIVSGENYHEGVIGLAAGKLVEEFYRPSIVFSIKGDIAKASARSISGFNIIKAIKSINLHIEGGGHPMAAGFSIKSSMIEKFDKAINKYSNKLLTQELLQKKIKADCNMDFDFINNDLIDLVKDLEPFGIGNVEPIFITRDIELLDARLIGRDSKHLKMKLKQNEHIFDSIYFGGGEIYSNLTPGSKIEAAYYIEENIWNGYKSIQLRIKDIKC